jgi:hypothetical protein
MRMRGDEQIVFTGRQSAIALRPCHLVPAHRHDCGRRRKQIPPDGGKRLRPVTALAGFGALVAIGMAHVLTSETYGRPERPFPARLRKRLRREWLPGGVLILRRTRSRQLRG